MQQFVKSRERPPSGSIPDVLQMFRAEVRFYREIAPDVGVRVPACHEATDDEHGTRLVIEDLTSWDPGADPCDAARTLALMHARWEGKAATRWPWLRRVGDGKGAEIVGALYDKTWPVLARRHDLSRPVRRIGHRLLGRMAAAAGERTAGTVTLVHGDASLRNMRTSRNGEVALLDWEDVRAAPGVADLAWLLVSSVYPEAWDDVIGAYGPAPHLSTVLPAAIVQGLLSLADEAAGSTEAAGWLDRLDTACRRLN
ncbi:MAG TPA: phosphotransferase [Actinopolymorphaceae bacterium]|nr:phosphotransferase [Actinopolymorphaceae bacterium]